MTSWEIADEDIGIVLKAHGVLLAENQIEAIVNQVDHDAIIDGLLNYADFDDQCQSALSDIEDQLFGLGVVGSDKHFVSP